MKFSQQIRPPTRPSPSGSLEAAAVAEAPDQPLVVRRHQLAVVERERAVRREDEQRVVDRAAVELVHADREVDAVLARDRADPLGRPRSEPRPTRARAAPRAPSRCLVPAGEAPRPAARRDRRERTSPGRRRAARPARRRLRRRSASLSSVASRSKTTGSTCAQATRTGASIQSTATTSSPTAISPSVTMSAFSPPRCTRPLITPGLRQRAPGACTARTARRRRTRRRRRGSACRRARSGRCRASGRCAGSRCAVSSMPCSAANRLERLGRDQRERVSRLARRPSTVVAVAVEPFAGVRLGALDRLRQLRAPGRC